MNKDIKKGLIRISVSIDNLHQNSNSISQENMEYIDEIESIIMTLLNKEEK